MELIDVARSSSNHPTELELTILQILWSRDTPASVREVQQALADGGRPLAVTTVTTVLNIMAKKKQLRRTRGAEGTFVYRPLLSHDARRGSGREVAARAAFRAQPPSEQTMIEHVIIDTLSATTMLLTLGHFLWEDAVIGLVDW